MPVLVLLLSGASSSLAGAAADVLAEIVLKRMDAAAKLRSAHRWHALASHKMLWEGHAMFCSLSIADAGQ